MNPEGDPVTSLLDVCTVQVHVGTSVKERWDVTNVLWKLKGKLMSMTQAAKGMLPQTRMDIKEITVAPPDQTVLCGGKPQC